MSQRNLGNNDGRGKLIQGWDWYASQWRRGKWSRVLQPSYRNRGISFDDRTQDLGSRSFLQETREWKGLNHGRSWHDNVCMLQRHCRETNVRKKTQEEVRLEVQEEIEGDKRPQEDVEEKREETLRKSTQEGYYQRSHERFHEKCHQRRRQQLREHTIQCEIKRITRVFVLIKEDSSVTLL